MLQRSAAAPPIPGVLFAEDFGDEDLDFSGPVLDIVSGAGSPTLDPDPIVALVPTPDEIEHGRRAAREEGFNAGLQAAERSLAATRTEISGRLEETLGRSLQQMHELVERSLGLVAETALCALVECLPALCARHGVAEMRQVVRSILPTVADELRLTLTVHPDVEHVLREEVGTLRSKPERILIRSTNEMLVGDITMLWEDGTASRDIGRWQNDMVNRLAELDGTTGKGGMTS